jgi:hypothetical protein
MGGINGYRYSAHTVKLHQERTKGNSGKPYLTRRGEPEVVLGEQLAPVLQEWCVRWFRDRPQGGYSAKAWGTGVDFVGPVQWLAQETGMNVRRISGICNGEFSQVPLTQADKLLAAIGRVDLMATGEIQVVPSVRWSMEKWVAYMQERGCG